jgi:hypothetical protein
LGLINGRVIFLGWKVIYVNFILLSGLWFFLQTQQDSYFQKVQALHLLSLALFFIFYFFCGKILFYFNFYKSFHEIEYLLCTFFTPDVTSVNSRDQLIFVNQLKKKKWYIKLLIIFSRVKGFRSRS